MSARRRTRRHQQQPREDPVAAAPFSALADGPPRVLLRRVFFLNSDRTRYLSVGFYPALHYLPLVEFGGARLKPILLNAHLVRTLATHLPILCSEMFND